MTSYRSKLAEYLASRKAICSAFFAAAAAAEAVCDRSTHSELTNLEQNAAQAVFKSQFRAAGRVRNKALNALGPPPDMPFGNESIGNSQETHKIEPYGAKQELSVALLEE